MSEKFQGIGNFSNCSLFVFVLAFKARSHQIKIATDLLQTGFRLASDSSIGVNGTMLYQCNPTAFCQSEASMKPVGSQSEASQWQI